MDISNSNLLLILVLGLVLLFVSMRCSFTCGGSEGFNNYYSHGSQLHDAAFSNDQFSGLDESGSRPASAHSHENQYRAH